MTYLVGVILTIGAVLFWSFTNILDKWIIEKRGFSTSTRQRTDAAIWTTVGAIGLVIFSDQNFLRLVLPFSAGLALFLGNFFVYQALRTQDTAVVAAHYPMFFLFSLAISVLNEGGILSGTQAIGSIIVFAAILLSSFSGNDVGINFWKLSTFAKMLPASALYAISFFLTDLAVEALDVPVTYSAMMFGGGIFFLTFYVIQSFVKGSRSLSQTAAKDYLLVFASEASNMAGIALVSIAYLYTTNVVTSAVAALLPISILTLERLLKISPDFGGIKTDQALSLTGVVVLQIVGLGLIMG